MDAAAHWETIYGKRPPEEQGWYTETPQPSLEWIVQSALGKDVRVLDTGGGASTLVDHLLRAGFCQLTVLDLSAEALEQAKHRLKAIAEGVRWVHDDVLTARFKPDSVDFWHDRAVFHFLHAAQDRERYKAQVQHALTPDGTLIVGSFRPGAPPVCSGLPVHHHSAEDLAAFFAPEFMLEATLENTHITPSGVAQDYVWVRLVRQRTGSEM